MLTIENIEVVYDHVFLAIKGVSLEVGEGGAVALLGSNGAGKSTTLKAISNLLRTERGEATFFSTTMVFGAPSEVTLSELAIESFFPADHATAAIMRALASEPR